MRRSQWINSVASLRNALATTRVGADDEEVPYNTTLVQDLHVEVRVVFYFQNGCCRRDLKKKVVLFALIFCNEFTNS